MTDYDIHSCGYYCDRPVCIKAQRNELRDKLFPEPTIDGWPLHSGLPQPKKEWVGLTEEEKTAIYKEADAGDWIDNDVLDAVEAKLKEKNA